MGKIDAIVFDMDGTVLYLNITKKDMELIRKKMNAFFKDYGIDEYFKPILQKIKISLENLRSQGIPEEEIQKIRDRAYTILDDFEEKAALNAQVRTEVPKTLNELSSYKLGLISSNGRKCVKIALKSAKIPLELFSTIVTRDDVENTKPDPEPLILAIKKMKLNNLKHRQIVYVGDHIHDMMCGKAAQTILKTIKVTTVGVQSKMFNPQNLRKCKKTDMYIKSFTELRGVIEKLEVKKLLNRITSRQFLIAIKNGFFE